MEDNNLHHIIIVGGGAGGLELATRLGDTLAKRKKARITLIDSNLTHVWKPLLHEVATGALNAYEDELSYLGQGYWHHFRFRLGRMDSIDRKKQEISLAPTKDDENVEYIPRRTFHYDTLILAVGSVTNDFGIPGVREHCFFLDNRLQADHFHQSLLRKYFSAHTQKEPLRDGQLGIAIAGAGATGIELSAALHDATRQLSEFGLDRVKPDVHVEISIIEGSDRVLPSLPERLSANTLTILKNLKINVDTKQRITEATARGFKTQSGKFVASEIKVWAAGIKAPDFLNGLGGLENNRINQLLVKQTLQTTLDDNIFAFGDCAACLVEEGSADVNVPPRAQTAHQQSAMLVQSMHRHLQGESLPKYCYVDYGSLVNLSRYSAVGNLMGNIAGRFSGSVMVEGTLARFMYASLYKMHQLALHGYLRVGLTTLANLLTRKSKPKMKLH